MPCSRCNPARMVDTDWSHSFRTAPLNLIEGCWKFTKRELRTKFLPIFLNFAYALTQSMRLCRWNKAEVDGLITEQILVLTVFRPLMKTPENRARWYWAEPSNQTGNLKTFCAHTFALSSRSTSLYGLSGSAFRYDQRQKLTTWSQIWWSVEGTPYPVAPDANISDNLITENLLMADYILWWEGL